jgi:hypothetical protein
LPPKGYNIEEFEKYNPVIEYPASNMSSGIEALTFSGRTGSVLCLPSL